MTQQAKSAFLVIFWLLGAARVQAVSKGECLLSGDLRAHPTLSSVDWGLVRALASQIRSDYGSRAPIQRQIHLPLHFYKEGETLGFQSPLLNILDVLVENQASAKQRLHLAILTSELHRISAQVDVIEDLIRRAKLCVYLGQTEEAWAALITASLVAKDPSLSLQSEKLRNLYSESVQKLYDEMISFQWSQKHDGLSSLIIAERARAFARSAPVQAGWKVPEDGVTVAYAVLPDRLLIWSIDAGGVSTLERKVSIRQVEEKVSRLLGEIRHSGPELGRISGDLYDLLLPEAITQLAGNKVVYFVPDRALNRLPFAALRNPRTGRFLIQDHPVSLARSVAGLGKPRPVPQTRPLVSVVNPNFDRKSFPTCAALEGAQAEAAFVSATFPNCRIMTGNLPTSERVLDELDRVDTFIFVGHAVTNSNLPSRSCLLVAPSTDRQDKGILAGEEIASHKFAHLNLVILSGCATVGPTTARSGGLAGVAARFLDAGAHTVVGTLWSLNDARSLPILAPFYRGLSNGRSPVLALQDSQVAAIAKGSEKVDDWADFVAVFN